MRNLLHIPYTYRQNNPSDIIAIPQRMRYSGPEHSEISPQTAARLVAEAHFTVAATRPYHPARARQLATILEAPPETLPVLLNPETPLTPQTLDRLVETARAIQTGLTDLGDLTARYATEAPVPDRPFWQDIRRQTQTLHQQVARQTLALAQDAQPHFRPPAPSTKDVAEQSPQDQASAPEISGGHWPRLRGVLTLLLTGTLAVTSFAGLTTPRAEADAPDGDRLAYTHWRVECPPLESIHWARQFLADLARCREAWSLEPLAHLTSQEATPSSARQRLAAKLGINLTPLEGSPTHDHAENQLSRQITEQNPEAPPWQSFDLSEAEWAAITAYTPSEVIEAAQAFDRQSWAFTRTDEAETTLYWRQRMASGQEATPAGWVQRLDTREIQTEINGEPLAVTVILEGKPDEMATRQTYGAQPVTDRLAFSDAFADRFTAWLNTLTPRQMDNLRDKTIIVTHVPELPSPSGGGVVDINSYTRQGNPYDGAAVERLRDGQVFQYRVYIGGKPEFPSAFDDGNNRILAYILAHVASGGIGQPLRARQGNETANFLTQATYTRNPPAVHMATPIIIQRPAP